MALMLVGRFFSGGRKPVSSLLPACFLIPLCAGWLAWRGEVTGLYGHTMAFALFTLANILAFTLLVGRRGQELVRMEVAQATAEEDIHQLADAIAQIVWTATPAGNIDYYNQCWYEYTGLTFEQTKDWGWRSIVHPDDLEATIEQWTLAFTSLGAYEVEFRLKRASDGQYRWHLARARHYRDAQGNVIRWVGTSTDIEDLKQAENKIMLLNEDLERRVWARTADLERAKSEMQEFVSIASHDMQEPLRKVQAFGDRLKTMTRETLSEQGRDYLDRMLSASQRMQLLIQDLLRFSRATTHTNQFSQVDLEQVTRSILSDRAQEIAAIGAHVEVGFLPIINADGLQMRQLFENLIGNALKFRRMGAAPSIRVYAEEEGTPHQVESVMRMVVEDDGIGFDEKHLDRIFCVFQRLHGRGEYEGTGVGLALCRKIVQRHGGQITARSTPGEGSMFLVTLPVRHSEAAMPVESSPVGVSAVTGNLL